jgi:hypothetical protein
MFKLDFAYALSESLFYLLGCLYKVISFIFRTTNEIIDMHELKEVKKVFLNSLTGFASEYSYKKNNISLKLHTYITVNRLTLVVLHIAFKKKLDNHFTHLWVRNNSHQRVERNARQLPQKKEMFVKKITHHTHGNCVVG